MPNTLVYNLISESEFSSDLLTSYFEAFEATQKASSHEELTALMNILEHSFMVFEEHLVLEFFDRCEVLCIELNANNERAKLYFLLAMTYFKQAEYTVATEYFTTSASLSAKSNSIENACISYCYASRCFLHTNNFESALQYIHTANWLYITYGLENDIVAMKIHHQYASIYHILKSPSLHYYLQLLNDFLKRSSNEKEKGKIHHLKALIAAQEKNYSEEYINLQLSFQCYLKTYNLNKRMIILNALLNCPAHEKTTATQNDYIIQLNALTKKIKNTYKDFSFKRLLHYFNLDRQNEIILPNSLQEKIFSDTLNSLLPGNLHLLIISLKNSSQLTHKQLVDKYMYIENHFYSHIDNTKLLSSYFDNQIVMALKDMSNETIRQTIYTLVKEIELKVGEISIGLTQTTNDTLTLRSAYNYAYADFYYNNSK